MRSEISCDRPRDRSARYIALYYTVLAYVRIEWRSTDELEEKQLQVSKSAVLSV